MSATEFDNALQAIISSSKGGIPSGTKIKEVASICVNNVQSESLLIQKLYLQFRKAPSTHKIGLLYIVDLILRDFLSNAKRRGEDSWPNPPDGTHMAGFNRLKEILPQFINDVLGTVTEDQKEKLRKLIDIWERGNILSPDFLAPFKSRLASPTPENGSTTPVGSPPPNFHAMLNGRPPQPPANPAPQSNAASTASILQALANMAKQTQTAPPAQPPVVAAAPPPVPTPVQQPVLPAQPSMPPSYGMPFNFPGLPQASTPAPPAPVPAPAANAMANLSAILGNLGKMAPQQQAAPTPPPPPPPPQIPQIPQFPQYQQTHTPTPPAPPAVDPNVQAQQLALLQLLIQQPQLAASFAGNPALAALLGVAAQQQQQQQQPAQPPAVPSWQQQFQQNQNQERDSGHARYSPPPRSPPHRNRFRSRSRSPVAGNKRPGSPISFRRRSPVYGEYGKDEDMGQHQQQMQGRGRGGGAGRGRGGFNRRPSPDYGGRQQRIKSPQQGQGVAGGIGNGAYGTIPPAGGPKRIERDNSIGNDRIKVYSRTLFVGGVNNIPDAELRDLFEKFGRVQSCIVNHEKRHAFIKMYTREDAVAAKEGMQTYRTGELTLRTRWGVGFGPRDCSDYETGVSIVPIDRLTDADRRWVVSADYGGTGGIPLEGGMCIEEPDIEIGQGVSSKAISKRRPTEHHGAQNQHQQHDGGNPNKQHWNQNQGQGHHGGGFNRRHEPHITGESGPGVPPPTPGFGFSLPFALPGQRPPGI